MPPVKGRKTRIAATKLRRSTREITAPETLKPASTCSVKCILAANTNKVFVPPVIAKKRPGRRPGRPPKNIAVEVNNQTATRPGRPKRVAEVAKVQIPETSTKRRGRPPKSASASSTPLARVSKAAGRPKAVKVEDTATKVAKKRRGPAKKAKTWVAAVASPIAKPVRFSIDNIEGEYEIQCHAISSGWDDGYSHDMTVDIGAPDKDDRVTGAFDLGFVSGVIRVAESKAELDSWCDTKTDEEIQAPTPETSPAPGTKRGRESERTKVAKRVKIEAAPAHAYRVWFRWRGENVVDNTLYDNDVKQTGWLDFPRADGSVFWGCIDLPTTAGSGIWIHGVRVSKKSDVDVPAWDEFESTTEMPQVDSDADMGAVPDSQAPVAKMTTRTGDLDSSQSQDDTEDGSDKESAHDDDDEI